MRKRCHAALAGRENRADGGSIEARRTRHDVVDRIGGGVHEGHAVFRALAFRSVARLTVLLVDDLSGRHRRATATATALAGTQEMKDAGVLVRHDVDLPGAGPGGGAAEEHAAV